MVQPKVYLQIPHYNNSKYLKDCIDSCQKLCYQNIDIHFFDDASNDNTVEILSEINPTNITIHRNLERLGRIKNYQYSYSHHGDADWMINLDSDDYYTHPEWIEEAMSIVASHPEDNITHIQSSFLCYLPSTKINFLKDYGDGYYLIRGDDYIELTIRHFSFSHFSSIFRTNIVDQTGAYIDNCLHADFHTAARAAARGNVLVGTNMIGVWRPHEDNQSMMRFEPNENQKIQISYYKLFEYLEDFLPYKKLKKIITTYEKRELDRKTMNIIHEKNYSQFISLIQDDNNSKLKLMVSFLFLFSQAVSKRWFRIQNLGSALLSKALAVVLSLAVLPWIVDILGIENYGWIGIYTTISTALYVFDFGLTGLITREVAKNDDLNKIQKIIGTQECVYLFIGCIIFGIIYFTSPWLSLRWLSASSMSADHKIDLLRIIGVALLFQWPHSFYTGALYGLDQQTKSNFSQLFLSILKHIGGLIILYFISPTIEAFFYWQIIISVITLIVQKLFIAKYAKIWNPFRHFSYEYWTQIKSLAIGISIISLFVFIYSDVTNFLLSKWLTLSEFGYYSILFNIAMGMIMYSSTLKNALFPSISKAVASTDKEKIAQIYIAANKLITYTIIPLSVFFILWGDDLFEIWFRNQIIVANLSPSVGWMTLGSLSNSMIVMPWAFLIAASNTRPLLYLNGCIAICSIPILYYLIEVYGLKGGSIYWFVINIIPMIILNCFYLFHSKMNLILSINQILSFPLLCSFILIISKYALSYLRIDSNIIFIFSSIFIFIYYIHLTYDKIVKLRNKI